MTGVPAMVVHILARTPIWVWLLYAVLLFLALQRTRTSVIPLWRMLILPIIVTFSAILTVLAAGMSSIPAIAFGLTIGSVVGRKLEPRHSARRLSDGRVRLQGEWWSFGLMSVVLVFRYTTTVAPIVSPTLAADPVWITATAFVMGSLTGLFVGRTVARLFAYAALPNGSAVLRSIEPASD